MEKKKKMYIRPEIIEVKVDKDISLIMMSNPPDDPPGEAPPPPGNDTPFNDSPFD